MIKQKVISLLCLGSIACMWAYSAVIKEDNLMLYYSYVEAGGSPGDFSYKVVQYSDQSFTIHSEFIAEINSVQGGFFSIIRDINGKTTQNVYIPDYAQRIEAMPQGEFYQKIQFYWDQYEAVLNGNLPHKPPLKNKSVQVNGVVYDLDTMMYQRMYDVTYNIERSIYQFIDPATDQVSYYRIIVRENEALVTPLGTLDTVKITYKQKVNEGTEEPENYLVSWYDCRQFCIIVQEIHYEDSNPAVTIVMNKIE